ncbi:MAG: VOC family protein [Chloroflexi bacterium]|nr:VOC family protein [Chloroflexota bacterium]
MEVPGLSPCLWFDGRAQEAAEFYVSVFPESELLRVEKIPAGPAEGSALVEFEIMRLRFSAIDGGPMFQFTPAVSFAIPCASQEEIDLYWERLSDGGTQMPCGWVEDRFGLSWQVVPAALDEIMRRNPSAVMEALLTMQKIDIASLRRAAG